MSFTHSDGDGEPVGSRWASGEEVLELCRAVSRHEGTTLEYVTSGCLRGFSDEEVDQMAAMTLAGRRPLNWNVLTIDSREPQRYHDQVGACEHARAQGGTAIALTMPTLVEMNMSFRNYCRAVHAAGLVRRHEPAGARNASRSCATRPCASG